MEAWAAACRRHVGGGMGGAGGPFGGYSCGGGNDPPRGRSPVTRGCRCGVPALGIPCGAHGEVIEVVKVQRERAKAGRPRCVLGPTRVCARNEEVRQDAHARRGVFDGVWTVVLVSECGRV